MTTVLAFGTFDPLHDGHRSFLAQAAALGDALTVVAARDSYIRVMKKREPRVAEEARQAALEREAYVATFTWGDEWPASDPYRLLRELKFDVVALGYDQQPPDEVVAELLRASGKPPVRVVRLKELAV